MEGQRSTMQSSVMPRRATTLWGHPWIWIALSFLAHDYSLGVSSSLYKYQEGGIQLKAPPPQKKNNSLNVC